ncbi:YdcF family protein [Nonomuraea ferruginea]|uniref:YdcF family protein n=1 Tax=Nonomuraea ferruginea TaxID=46174 RepID=A0ABT4SR34_9ACTN|nr:YdcF family protein [Nonomuraea ferruginea]MDA0639311.1 YdcF family protein [Nonomuraea ferruginea]
MTVDISPEQVSAITAFVDVEAPPPAERPTAHFLFGTNQIQPVDIAAERYHKGLAPLIICTGGVNRHNGIVEGSTFRRLLLERDVPNEAIRVEAQSMNTWQNVEYALPFLREACRSRLTITAVCKWYHRRTVHILKGLAPEISTFHAITWEPLYSGRPITRTDWPGIPEGSRRVIREWEEVTRRVADGSLSAARLVEGAWC